MSGLELTLVVAALLAGVCGTWSPCGFSMIETIGPHGHDGGRATTVSACATFTVGALVGGVITFGALAALGELRARSGRRRVVSDRGRAGGVRGGRRAPRHADPAAAAPPAPRALAPADAHAGRRRALRRPAGARVHHVRAHVRRLRARRNRVRARRPADRARDRAGLRRRAGGADRARRARSPTARPASGSPRRWPGGPGSTGACASATGSRCWPPPRRSSSRSRRAPRTPSPIPPPIRR